MAYVAISNGLISSTEHNIRDMRNKEKEAVPTVPESGTVPDNDANITALIWGNHQHLCKLMPDEWKARPGKVTLRIDFDMGEGFGDRKYTADFQVAAPNGFEVPRTEQSSSYYGFIHKVDESNPLLPQGARDLVAYRKQMHMIDKRWEDVSSKVRQFLCASKSLNEALKVWPGLSLYVAKDYIDRVNNKGTPREKTKSDVEALAASIDLDSLTAAAVASKLTV